MAVKNKDYDMLRYLKKQKYTDFNLPNAEGESALFAALHINDMDLVKFLVEECQVDIEHKEIQARTPLYYTCSVGNLESARYLISRGASVNSVTSMGRTALKKAAWNGEHEMVKVLLEYPNVNLSIGDS